MSSNLRVDRILPSTGTEVGVGTATGSVALYGDVNIAGTLTYEDVTNIDSVGIVTARSDVHVGSALSVTGISTFGNSVHVTSGQVLVAKTTTSITTQGSRVDNGLITVSGNSNSTNLAVNGGGNLSLANIDSTDNNFSNIGGYNSNGLVVSQIDFINKSHSSRTGDIAFLTHNGSAMSERLRITSDGTVIVGTDTTVNPILRILGTSAHNSFIQFADGDSNNVGQLQYSHSLNALIVAVNGGEKLRITSDGRLLLGTTDAGGNNTANHLVVSNNAGANDQAGMTIRGGTSGRSQIFFSDGNSGQDEYRGMLRYDHQDNSMQFRTNAVEKLRITSAGLVNVTGGIQVTENVTPTSGRGVEIFEASAGVGLIQSYNRTGTSFDELRFRGSEVRLYSSTNLRLDIQNAQSYLYGTSDGVLNISTTDSRGSFIRYQLNGSTKCWAGCSQGLGTGGNQDDFGIRATRDLRVKTGSSNTMRLTAAGYLQVASDGDVTGDNENIFRQHQTTYNVLQLRAETSSYQASGGGALAIGVIRSASSSYVFGGFYSGNNSSNFQDRKFSFRGDGQGYADGAWNGGGADYAEYFEWSDGNTSSEDRRGISVVLDGDKIREATSGEDPIGVISANPSVVGDADDLQWKNKYLRTEYGSFDLDENGEQKLNPDYNPNQEYVSRENRPEWDCVGLMGKLRIRKGQITGSRWIKMRDVSVNVEEWLVR